MAQLEVTYDREADAAYIFFREIEDGGAVKQLQVEGAPGTTIFDLDAEGRLIGLEVLGASSALPQVLLDQAELIG